MPFRKLPNTDTARVAALDTLIRKADAVPEAARPCPADLHAQAVTLRAQFKPNSSKRPPPSAPRPPPLPVRVTTSLSFRSP